MRETLDYCADLPVERCEAGDLLFVEGRRSGQLVILRDGILEVLRGDTPISRIDEPGAILGEMSVLLDVPHTATVRAASPVAVHVAADPAGFLRDNPIVALFLARGLAQRLNAATTYLVDIKRQYGDQDDHLSMVSEVLDVLIHQDDKFDFSLGSDRVPDPPM
ncbi:MAG: cyclic nucleotide-binding domain-containing protein [Hyphomicrobiales bacterium]|nr:cyclic nucleotide-binding domain-containing protein [Hyphomicrobiales bacterium]